MGKRLFFELLRRIAFRAKSDQASADLEEEMQFHLAMREERNREQGMPPGEAARQAHTRFGNTSVLRERSREQWIWPWLEGLIQDVRYAFRGVRQNPGFATAVIASLTLGIGANTAIFTLVQQLLLKDLPVHDPQQLLILNWSVQKNRSVYSFGSSNRKDPATGRHRSNVFSWGTFRQVRDEVRDTAEVFAFASLRNVTVALADRSTVAPAAQVSGNFHDALRVRPLAGRLLDQQDDQPGAEPVAVISYGFWQRQFGGRNSAIGAHIRVNGVPFTIVGVTPSEFYGVSRGGWIPAPEITVSLETQPLVARAWVVLKPGATPRTIYMAPDVYWLQLMARVRDGVLIEQARAKLDAALHQAESRPGTVWAGSPDVPRLEVTPGSRGLDGLRRQFETPLTILMCVVATVLLIACANVANLMLARSAARQREIAFRVALGASRGRIVRQLMTEGALLVCIGAALGFALAHPAVPALLQVISTDADRIAVAVVPDLSVLLFTVFATGVAVLLTGLAPALRGSRVGFLRGKATRQPVSRTLVSIQVALSLVLLAGAGLFTRSLYNLRTLDVGFRPEGLVVFGVSPVQAGHSPEQAPSVYRRLLDTLSETPGILNASMAGDRLLADWNSTVLMRTAEEPATQRRPVTWNGVGPGYMATAGIRLVAGREFAATDGEKSPAVAIVNESAARQYFGGNAVGKRFYRSIRGAEEPIEVVGVVRDAFHSTVRAGPYPMIYLPYAQSMSALPGADFLVRTAGIPANFFASIREAVRKVDAGMPVIDMKTQTAQVDELLNRERMFAKLTVLFASLALLLSSLGLYGVIAYGVTRRTAEIGIRIALGASAGHVLLLFLRQAGWLIALGVIGGIPVILAASRGIASQLYGVQPTDWRMIAGAASLLAVVAFGATLIPARKAAAIAPTVALRYE